jgi:hypothetical protein
MVHPSGIYTMVVVFKLIEINMLSHCTEVEKVVGKEMIHLFLAVVKNVLGPSDLLVSAY